ncbi:ABC transporter permease subunit [Congregibacter litoralis]|uniref:ABC transporter permease subunit n=1 Tax=Congregibacter litoralis TaxID=393662 RepID=UPI00058FCB3D|nr:ABC transporter permease subunit [Congregibacter litoralis]
MTETPFRIAARRRARDRMATVAIAAAGGAVIIMILLILAYLLYVAMPLASVTRIEAVSTETLPAKRSSLVFAGERRFLLPEGARGASGEVRRAGQHAVRLRADTLEVFAIPPAGLGGDNNRPETLEVQATIGVSGALPASLAVDARGERLLYAFFDQQGVLHAGELDRPAPSSGVAKRHRLMALEFSSGVVQVDAGSGLVVVVKDRSYLRWTPGAPSKSLVQGQLPRVQSVAKHLAWGPNHETLLLVDEDNRVYRFDTARADFPLLGEPWVAPINVRGLVSEDRRRVVYFFGEEGELLVQVPSSKEELLREIVPALKGPGDLGLDVDDNVLYRLTDTERVRVRLRNPSPETGWRSLWLAQWFGGYDAPGQYWHPDGAAIGVLSKLSLSPLLYGTFKAAIYGMLLAIPLSLGAAVYTGYFLPPRIRNRVKPSIEMLEAFPTVVLGFVAGLWLAPLLVDYLLPILLLPVLLLALPLLLSLIHLLLQLLSPRFQRRPPRVALVAAVYLLATLLLMTNGEFLEGWLLETSMRDWLWREWGIAYEQRNALLVGMAMGIAITPVMFSIIEDSIFAVPRSLSDGSLALGATRWQSLARVVLPAASPAILSALLIGIARGLGETMIVLLATGNTPLMEPGAFTGLRSLSASIVVELPEAGTESVQFRLLFLAALVLFGLTFVLNTVAELFRQRLRYAYANR